MLELINNNDLKLIEYLNSISGFNISSGIYDKIFAFKVNSQIIGFINFSIIYDRSELNYIFVLEKYRRNGYSKVMMEFLINYVKNNNCLNITLEVRKNNISAINLYKKFEFKVIADRKKYYGNEDAILMLREV